MWCLAFFFLAAWLILWRLGWIISVMFHLRAPPYQGRCWEKNCLFFFKDELSEREVIHIFSFPCFPGSSILPLPKGEGHFPMSLQGRWMRFTCWILKSIMDRWGPWPIEMAKMVKRMTAVSYLCVDSSRAQDQASLVNINLEILILCHHQPWSY